MYYRKIKSLDKSQIVHVNNFNSLKLKQMIYFKF